MVRIPHADLVLVVMSSPCVPEFRQRTTPLPSDASAPAQTGLWRQREPVLVESSLEMTTEIESRTADVVHLVLLQLLTNDLYTRLLA